MDLRVLVLTADLGLSELIRAQVENLGCVCTLRDTYDEASSSIDWADAAIVDLVGDGLDDLCRLRVEAPRVRILAIAPDARAGAGRLARPAPTRCWSSRSRSPTSSRPSAPSVRSGDARVVDIRTGVVAAAPAGRRRPLVGHPLSRAL